MSDDKVLPVAVVKRDFSQPLKAAEHGQRTVVVRHGRPVADLGPVRSERPDLPSPRRPGGLLALLGTLSDWETLDADIAEVLAARHAAADRPLPEFDRVAMAYLFDTDTISAVLRPRPDLGVARRLSTVAADEQFTSAITLSSG